MLYSAARNGLRVRYVGAAFRLSLLVAAHIKTRSECSRQERLDERYIVFGACLLGCDSLYERGIITVGEDGRMLISVIQASSDLREVLKIFKGRTCPAWNTRTKEYFAWHRTGRFQGARKASSRRE